ncbi:hypothetical protein VM1G_07677 [Cytospora mali]|uniref:Uncharacterized protein n=1 Tax=Cytospora mali TaxID=578113 RepID=A0A194W746_CYTMA|nr:hypothetical protein VM1G_07677 [Valsa mali]
MDPLSILSLTGNLLKLLSCGRDMINLAKEIHRSPAGAAKADESAASIAKRSQALSQAVRLDTSSSLLTEDQQRLCDAASECEKICSELGEELSKSRRGKGKKCAIVSVWLAVRSRFARDKIKELEERLARCEGQMSAQLLHIMQSDFKATWAEFLATSATNQTHITAVQEGVDILRQGLQVSSLDEAVLQQLRGILDTSEENILRRRQNQILRALRFDSMNDRFAGVSDAHERTFEWMFNEHVPDPHTPVDDKIEYSHPTDRCLRLEARDKFVKWLEARPVSPQDAVFHILGKPGAGKSTLMKYLSRHEKTRTHLRRWSGDKELVVGFFFFWKPGSDPQKSQRGLVRSLLYSILSDARDLIPTAFPTQWPDTQSLTDGLVILEQHHIEEAFNKIIRQPQTYDRYRFGFFLDGLDEFEDKLHHKTKQQLVALILGWVRESKGQIKVIASSRHHVEFESGFDKSPGIRLQDLTRPDMATVVAGRLAEIQCFAGITSVDSLTLFMIESRILEKAQGVFLWVTLVLRGVEAGIIQGDSWRALEQKIDALPVELEDLLQCMFDGIDSSDRAKALLTFAAVEHRSICSSGFPLWLYSFLGDIVLDPDFVTKQPPSMATHEQIEVQLIKSKRQVYGVCKGLLEVIGRDNSLFVDFTHRSVVEFLKQPKIKKETHRLAGYHGHLHILWQCFLGCVKIIGFPNSHDNEFAYNVCMVIQEYLSSTCQTQQQGPERRDERRICDFLDHLIECVEGRKRFQYAFFEANEASGGENSSGVSPAVELSVYIVTETCLYEYVSRYKKRFAKILNDFHVMPSLWISCRNSPSIGGRRWLEMIHIILDGETVSPKGAAIYLTQSIALYLSRLKTDIGRFLSPKSCDGDGDPCVYFPGKVDPAVFLAYILHGGDMAISINFAPDGKEMQYCKMDVITDSFPMELSIVAEGFPKAFLLAAHPLWFQDIVEMVFSGRTLALFREMIDERNKYPDLDDWQAGIRLREKFGTAAQVWDECQNFMEESCLNVIMDYKCPLPPEEDILTDVSGR